jgi:Tfp pilus assembly protein PilV
MRRGASRRGFTLMETGLATIIIGLSVMSVMELLAKGTTSNYDGAQQTTAINLAKNIREMTLNLAFTDATTPNVWGLDAGKSASNPLSFTDINDLDGLTFCPPLDARRVPIAGWTDWTQSIVVHSVDPNRLTLDVPDGTTPANRITVTISHKGTALYTMTWYAFDGNPP